MWTLNRNYTTWWVFLVYWVSPKGAIILNLPDFWRKSGFIPWLDLCWQISAAKLKWVSLHNSVIPHLSFSSVKPAQISNLCAGKTKSVRTIKEGPAPLFAAIWAGSGSRDNDAACTSATVSVTFSTRGSKVGLITDSSVACLQGRLRLSGSSRPWTFEPSSSTVPPEQGSVLFFQVSSQDEYFLSYVWKEAFDFKFVAQFQKEKDFVFSPKRRDRLDESQLFRWIL